MVAILERIRQNSIWKNCQSVSDIDKTRIKTIDSNCNYVQCINLVSDGNNSDRSNNHDIVIRDDTKRNTMSNVKNNKVKNNVGFE